MQFVQRAGVWSAAICLSIILTGCDPAAETAQVELPADDELKQRIDEILNFTLENRQLNTRDHAAWQILHGALAFGRSFEIEHEGRRVSAVEHMLAGGKIKGWTAGPGFVLETIDGEDVLGLRAEVEQGSGTGQGHYDQWLAVLAQCGLREDEEIKVDDRVYKMSQYVRQVQLEIPRNLVQEYSWTLIGLTSYMPTTATWEAFDGSQWSIEELVDYEAEHVIGEGACGGTHRLIGLSMALNQHVAQGNKVEGAWQRADQRIQEAIRRAKEFQNPDGSFSTNYLIGGGSSPDLSQNLRNTGHIVEFLALSLTKEQLREEWVRRAVVYLCGVFEKTKKIDMECGALYHAAHGLVLYRQRMNSENPSLSGRR